MSAAWSVAGVGTCIQLRHPAFGLHIALDMGTSAGEVRFVWVYVLVYIIGAVVGLGCRSAGRVDRLTSNIQQ